MSGVRWLLGVCLLAAGCAASDPPTLGTAECASASATCPSECLTVRGSALDATNHCVRGEVAICSRRPLGSLAITQCCVRTRDGLVFALSGSTRCPQEPEYVAWRACTAEESAMLGSASQACP